MIRVVLTAILALVVLAIPANSQAPASTGGDSLVTTEISQEINLPANSVPASSDKLDIILPLTGPSIHTDYVGEANTYVWRDINGGQYHVYGVENGKFVYQPGDTWFVYGIFGLIEAVKYDWNVKYTNWGGRHNGIDFAAPVGLSVVSASEGEVIFAGERAGYTIIIQTGNFQITYSHLDSFVTKVGERVSQGQLIGYTGSSGTPNPHLHFEIDKYANGQRWGINPMKFLLPELQTATMPDVPTNRYIDGPLLWNNLAESFRW
ncbi:MAG: M23 family metallopeptidase [Candidatus Edwardsbacteria bacterium]|nr:M23 family metallopeptidase [Candidatus Edwardsbacteria bacterium]MBU1577787.1 M23 family metallopeptidase [Candidatus Edwardsbacteria bacterium]